VVLTGGFSKYPFLLLTMRIRSLEAAYLLEVRQSCGSLLVS
jgi:hypothetical protein